MTSCPHCRTENPSDSRFCGRCGTRIGSLEGLSLTRTVSPLTAAVTKGESFAGRYEILDELGRGGMGVVYKASDTKLKRIVALKFLPPEAMVDSETKDRFVREAQAAASLDHPSICTIHEIDEADGKPFISMAYIEGQSLRESIRTGPLPEDDSLEIAIQVADGLEEAHKKGIIHRDIKPANVMITPKGRIKIMDFGLAKVSGSRTTREGVVMGTLAYMPPEQARGEPADHRSDIWSLGAVIYEMITGSLPFPGDKDAIIVNGIQNAEVVPLSVRRPGTSPEIEHIIKRALAKSPGERYQGAGEMKADMERVLGILRGRRARPETAADLLTVIPFENLADPDDRAREARMISNLVLTALSATGGLRVAGEQRLFDGLKEIGHGGERTIDRTVAAQLARLVGSTKMVVGEFSRLGDRAILTSKILRVHTG
ncbi:MAG TPA: serine/threonine-protein kinase, partial [Acidobacteriota bacterium]|nr:serine/threonine-protein kinase [Acidobacteriota bacterium]